jgi:hypothetical protein
MKPNITGIPIRKDKDIRDRSTKQRPCEHNKQVLNCKLPERPLGKPVLIFYVDPQNSEKIHLSC